MSLEEHPPGSGMRCCRCVLLVSLLKRHQCHAVWRGALWKVLLVQLWWDYFFLQHPTRSKHTPRLS